jgi:hypothetical protein
MMVEEIKAEGKMTRGDNGEEGKMAGGIFLGGKWPGENGLGENGVGFSYLKKA